jgi:hypothetical protein
MGLCGSTSSHWSTFPAPLTGFALAPSPRAGPGVLSWHGAVQASSQREIPMSDKSPRQSMSKKTGKSIKEKRADKRNKGSDDAFSDKIHPTKKK